MIKENFSVTFLLERGIEHFQQKQYAEGMTLFTLVGECFTPEQTHLAGSLDMLIEEYARYSEVQQKMQELIDQFVEAQDELRACNNTLSVLHSMLLKEMQGGRSSHTSDRVHQNPRQSSHEDRAANPTLYAVCLGPFEVRRLGSPIALCSNRNGQAILRYLIARPDHSATTDTLMNILWPDDIEEVALRKLHVTMSILRRSLQTGYDSQEKYILHKHGIYQLNPSIPLRTDFEEFLRLYTLGRKEGGEAAVYYYEKACPLYTRPFLMEDLYMDWSFPLREQLRQIHLEICSTLTSHYFEKRAYETSGQWATMIIGENPCDEPAYRQLMRIYTLAGRRDDAIRQYQRCQQVLRDELNLAPMPETVTLYKAILRGELSE
jgi:DNA-binding SARP family transcriptional activator